MSKIIIYQALVRTFGNTNPTNKPWGSIEENGCGKMADFTLKRLQNLRKTGYTHVWPTGLLRHATQTDYTRCGIEPDHPDIVKGIAGSPYAVKDYYDIDPDLAVRPEERMEEFEAFVGRIHKAGLKVIMDFVPNHVARQYKSTCLPKGRQDLGENDDTSLRFSTDNNFYYQPGQALQLDDIRPGSTYVELPAKATGNDRFDNRPNQYDWYETIKLNYGIDYQCGRTRFFPTVGEQDANPDLPVPSTWVKMTEILNYWSGKGIDAFRCDMAEMVPVEFWHYAISRVRRENPSILFIAEVYDRSQYRSYIHNGGFDLLYNKVGLYDTLRSVARGEAPASRITSCWQEVDDIRDNMLNFLENHDEQRIASPFFCGDAKRGLPAFMAAALMDRSSVMVYAGQELGENGMLAEGFSGEDGRSSIFDYCSVPTLVIIAKGRRYFTDEEKGIYDTYTRIIELCGKNDAIANGSFFDLMYANYDHYEDFNCDKQYAFLRSSAKEVLLIVINFDEIQREVKVNIPSHAFDVLNLQKGTMKAHDLLSGEDTTIVFAPDKAVEVTLPSLGGIALTLRPA